MFEAIPVILDDIRDHIESVCQWKTAATMITSCIDAVIVAITSNVVNATIALSVKFSTSICNDK